jgi:hypothetical protein
MTWTLETRVLRLEECRKRRGSYVVHVCDPPTQSELAEIRKADSEGRKIALIPHACRSIDEWVTKYGGEAVHVKTGFPRPRVDQ